MLFQALVVSPAQHQSAAVPATRAAFYRMPCRRGNENCWQHQHAERVQIAAVRSMRMRQLARRGGTMAAISSRYGTSPDRPVHCVTPSRRFKVGESSCCIPGW
jgi:hypothetical protein